MAAQPWRLTARSQPGATWALVAVLLLGLLPLLRGLLPEDAVPTRLLTQAQRSLGADAPRPVTLPDTVLAPSRDAIVSARYRVEVELGAPRPLALYASGLLGHARITLNGALLVDEFATPLPPSPRGLARLRLLDLPGALLQPGRNVVEIRLAGRGLVSLSSLRLDERQALEPLRDRKALAMIIGPAIVAAVIGCLGVSMGVLYLRLRSEAMYGYFGLGATLWALHTAWTLSPRRLLSGVHLEVWWNALYAAFVVMLVLFCLRYSQRSRPAIERVLLAGCVATPAALYAAASLGLIAQATEALRLLLVLLATAALGVVAHHAWYRRRLDSALLVLSGLAGAGFGLRDWLVFHGTADNLPVALTPYAGLPFSLLVSALLIERFVRTTEGLETLNHQLDQRVARRETELAANYERVAALERAQAAADERQRIQRELHDGVGAKLAAALLRVESGGLDGEGLAQELRACLADMRLASEALVPGEADLGAVVGNLLFRWQSLLRDAGVRARWQVELPPQGLGVAPYMALQLLRVMQEALTNVLRHAQAREVRLRLSHDGAALSLVVEDDGCGIAPASMPAGRGLTDLRSRAAAIGAQFVLDAPPGGGTRIALVLPLPVPPLAGVA